MRTAVTPTPSPSDAATATDIEHPTIPTPEPSSWPDPTAGPAGPADQEGAVGSRFVLDGVVLRGASGATIIDGVSLSIAPGQLVAIVGASGSGKSSLLDVLAGNAAPTSGRAAIDGRAATALTIEQRRQVGFVPQDEVLHEDLSLRRMLTYAARLRVPIGSKPGDRAVRAVTRALAQVELQEVAELPVRSLSGGQRRRASLAIELLTDPRSCLLDEPTSGLDPATAESVLRELRALADRGRTVVFVTHNADDLRLCDRIVAVGPGGRLVFDGTPSEAARVAGSNDTARVHRLLITATSPLAPLPGLGLGSGSAGGTESAPPTSPDGDRWPDDPTGGGPGAIVGAGRRFGQRARQLATLTARTLELVVRNRLTAAIMVGSPALVVAMFAILFQAGAFDPAEPGVTSAIMAVFWVAFGGFFFGLTYGLLQICPEVPTMQRERRAGVPAGLQILAKLAALTPVLLAIDVAMLAVLVGLDRLPSAGLGTYTMVAITLGLDAVAALALGLLASALVRSPAQASLALPLLCFPAVLFSGAVLPVPVMAPVGRAISAAMPDRWAFDAIGADLGLPALLAGDVYGPGPSLLTTYGDTWTRQTETVWLILLGFTGVLVAAAWAALAHRCGRPSRGSARPSIG